MPAVIWAIALGLWADDSVPRDGGSRIFFCRDGTGRRVVDGVFDRSGVLGRQHSVPAVVFVLGKDVAESARVSGEPWAIIGGFVAVEMVEVRGGHIKARLDRGHVACVLRVVVVVEMSSGVNACGYLCVDVDVEVKRRKSTRNRNKRKEKRKGVKDIKKGKGGRGKKRRQKIDIVGVDKKRIRPTGKRASCTKKKKAQRE